MSGLARSSRRARSKLAQLSYDAGAEAGVNAGKAFAVSTLRKLAEYAREKETTISSEQLDRLADEINKFK